MTKAEMSELIDTILIAVLGGCLAALFIGAVCVLIYYAFYTIRKYNDEYKNSTKRKFTDS